jgi:hypothetical protein
MTEKFRWDKNILWFADGRRIAGWVDYDFANQFWFARTAGTLTNPPVRAEFDNQEAARDFLMFIANSEDT